MFDPTAITSAPSRTAIAVGLVLSTVLSVVAVTRALEPSPAPCAITSPPDDARGAIQTRTHELNRRYFTRDRFDEPMLRR